MKEKVQAAAAAAAAVVVVAVDLTQRGLSFDVLRKLYESRINRVEIFFCL